MADFRILVTGSRDWTYAEAIRFELAGLSLLHRGNVVVVHGACPKGADRIADLVARELGLRVERHPADWTRHGKRAGFVRNAEMVALGASVCLAGILPCTDAKCRRPGPHGSHGASHCAHLAEANGIETRRFNG
jgi:hypothetical protein